MKHLLIAAAVTIFAGIACAGGSGGFGTRTIEVNSGGTDVASLEKDWLAALTQPGVPFILTLTEDQVEAVLVQEFVEQAADDSISDINLNFDDGLARLTYDFTFDLPNRPTVGVMLDFAINVVNGDLQVETQQAEIANENISVALPQEVTAEIDAELTRALSAQSVDFDGTVTYTAVTIDNDVVTIEGVAER